MVILFASDKGGVGKSTTAANMAVMMSRNRAACGCKSPVLAIA
ncbi:P-loop NTPase [Pseudomonas syringae]|nr:P-loop NTPase [Pseudomonas syringae]